MDAVSPADEEFAEELAALRRRAYDPDADIRADPIAGARLAELERAHDRHHADPARDESVHISVADGEDRYERSSDTTSALSAPEPAAPTAHRLRRALPWITAAVAVLVAVGALCALYTVRTDEQLPVDGLTPLTGIPEACR